MAQIQQSGTPINLSATGTISKVSGSLLGFYVNSTSAATLVFRVGSAGTSSGTAINAAMTPAVGFNGFFPYCPDGLHVTQSGTGDVTYFFAAG